MLWWRLGQTWGFAVGAAHVYRGGRAWSSALRDARAGGLFGPAEALQSLAETHFRASDTLLSSAEANSRAAETLHSLSLPPSPNALKLLSSPESLSLSVLPVLFHHINTIYSAPADLTSTKLCRLLRYSRVLKLLRNTT